MLDMLSIMTCETPTFSRKRFMVSSEACHHRTCSFRRTSRMALSRSVLKRRMDLPTLKSSHELGFGAPTAVSVQVRRTRCSRSGPRTFRGRPLSGAAELPSTGSVPVETVLGPGPAEASRDSPASVPPVPTSRASPSSVPPGLAPPTPTSSPSGPRRSPEPELLPDGVGARTRCCLS